jgi:hypothetical protein
MCVKMTINMKRSKLVGGLHIMNPRRIIEFYEMCAFKKNHKVHFSINNTIASHLSLVSSTMVIFT